MNRSPLEVAVAAACTAVLMLPLAGCGKDDKPEAGAASTLDPAVVKYVADAETVCTAARAEIDVIKNDAKPSPSPAELSALLARVSVALVAEIDQLKTITPPTTIATNVDDWLKSLTTAAKKTKGQTRKSILEAKVSLFADADSRAEAIGVHGCRTDAQ